MKNFPKRCLLGSLVLTAALLIGCSSQYVAVSDKNSWESLGYHSQSSFDQAPGASNTFAVILPDTSALPATGSNSVVTIYPTVTTDSGKAEPTVTIAPAVTIQPQTTSAPESSAPVNPGGSLTVLEFSQTVAKGNKATVTIRGLPNTEYTIKVKYSSGYSTAAGLEPKISDANGVCSWTWKVGGSTKPGSYPITISDGTSRYTLTFTVE